MEDDPRRRLKGNADEKFKREYTRKLTYSRGWPCFSQECLIAFVGLIFATLIVLLLLAIMLIPPGVAADGMASMLSSPPPALPSPAPPQPCATTCAVRALSTPTPPLCNCTSHSSANASLSFCSALPHIEERCILDSQSSALSVAVNAGLKRRRLTEPSTAPCLPHGTSVNDPNIVYVGAVGGLYTLNGATDEFSIGAGTYYFTNIPSGHPMRITDESTYSPCTDSITNTFCQHPVISGGNTFCYGSAAWTIPETCQHRSLTLRCSAHGYGMGLDRLHYNNLKCHTPTYELQSANTVCSMAALLVSTRSECHDAARQLGLGDTYSTEVDISGAPKGCYFDNSETLSQRLVFNTYYYGTVGSTWTNYAPICIMNTPVLVESDTCPQDSSLARRLMAAKLGGGTRAFRWASGTANPVQAGSGTGRYPVLGVAGSTDRTRLALIEPAASNNLGYGLKWFVGAHGYSVYLQSRDAGFGAWWGSNNKAFNNRRWEFLWYPSSAAGEYHLRGTNADGSDGACIGIALGAGSFANLDENEHGLDNVACDPLALEQTWSFQCEYNPPPPSTPPSDPPAPPSTPPPHSPVACGGVSEIAGRTEIADCATPNDELGCESSFKIRTNGAYSKCYWRPNLVPPVCATQAQQHACPPPSAPPSPPPTPPPPLPPPPTPPPPRPPPTPPTPPSAPPLRECSLDAPPYHVLWTVESECADAFQSNSDGVKGGRPYINNLGGTGSHGPSVRHDCDNEADGNYAVAFSPVPTISCSAKVMYFRNVLAEYPAGSGMRVDLKISAIDTARIPDYANDITYDVNNDETIVGGSAGEVNFGIQGCFFNRPESLQMVMHGVTGAFDFEFVRPDQTPVTLSAYFLTAFDLDKGSGGTPGFDAFGVIYKDANGDQSGLRRVGLFPPTIDDATCPGDDNGGNGCTQLTCCHGTGYSSGDECYIDAGYSHSTSPFTEPTQPYTRAACTEAWPNEKDMHFRAKNSVYSNVPEPTNGPFNLAEPQKLHAVTAEMQDSSRVMVLMSGRPVSSGHRLSLTGGLSNVIGLCPPTAPPPIPPFPPPTPPPPTPPPPPTTPPLDEWAACVCPP